MIRLMIVDDHTMFRDGLRSQFKAVPDVDVAGEADSAAALMAGLAGVRPDVVLLDIKLPDASGTSLIERIRAIRPRCRILVLTMFDHVRYAIHAMEQGADGFLLKGATFEELLSAIRQVHTGKPYLSREVAAKLALRMREGKPGTSLLDQISKREFEVLTHLGRGLSAKETALALALSEKTVSTYKARLMHKLSLSSRADIIRYAMENGLLE